MNGMTYVEILQERIRQVCAVVDSLELYKKDPSTHEQFNKALAWLPEKK